MKTNVILIDDDKDTIDLFEDYLELKGINVLGKGKNGKEAVELYVKHKPDIVFLDVMMPDYDGFYGLKNIRAIDPSSKIIMVTADMTGKTKNRLQILKASEIIYKPYDINTILETIQKINNENKVLLPNIK